MDPTLAKVKKKFPRLTTANCRLTSPEDRQYNCIAWAAGDSSTWWEPDSGQMYSWPAGVNRTYTVDAYLEAYGTLGYVPCGGDATLRDGYQKVALYTKNNFPTHAARQLPDGWWASKLGQYVDVEHTLVALDGPDYGEATIFLERPIP